MHHFLVEAIRICSALLLFLLPGLLVCVLLRLSTSRIQLLPISFAIGMVLLTVLNIPLMAMHGHISWLPITWTLLSILLAAELFRRKFGNWRTDFANSLSATRTACLGRLSMESILALGCIVSLAFLSICLFFTPCYLEGETEIELIITRKILENSEITLNNINYLPDYPPTYLLTPFYLFRAFISFVSKLDPILVHYRMGFFPVLMAILLFSSFAFIFTKSKSFAQWAIILAVVHTLFAPLRLLDESPFLFLNIKFFRGIIAPQALTPLCLLFFLLFIESDKNGKKYAFLILGLILTALVTQAYTAPFLLFMMALGCVGVAIAGKPASWRELPKIHGLLRVIMLVVSTVAMLLVYKQIFNSFHSEFEEIERYIREDLKGNLLAALHNPVRLFYGLPVTELRFKYFHFRGVVFEDLGLRGLTHFAPPVVIGWLSAYILFFFKRNFQQTFLLLVVLVSPLLVSIPIISIAMLYLSQYVFANWIHNLSFFYYLALFFAAFHAASLIAKFTKKKGFPSSVVYSVIPVIATLSYFLIGGGAQLLSEYLQTHSGEFYTQLLIFYGIALVIGVVSCRKRMHADWKFNDFAMAKIQLTAVAILIPLLLRGYGYGQETLIDTLPKNFKRMKYVMKWGGDYAKYTENIWPTANLTPGFFKCLVFVRNNIAPHSMFACPPTIIRTIPLLTNQYIAHSGVPFDFEETYFARYYKTNVEDGAVMNKENRNIIVESRDPFFQKKDRLSESSLNDNLHYITDFKIDYLVVTPEFHDDVANSFELLRKRAGVKARRIYDEDLYSLYQITRTKI